MHVKNLRQLRRQLTAAYALKLLKLIQRDTNLRLIAQVPMGAQQGAQQLLPERLATVDTLNHLLRCARHKTTHFAFVQPQRLRPAEIVRPALLRVGENLVGLRDALKLALGGDALLFTQRPTVAALHHIGVEHLSKVFILRLHLRLCCGAPHLQHLVRVLLTPTRRRRRRRPLLLAHHLLVERVEGEPHRGEPLVPFLFGPHLFAAELEPPNSAYRTLLQPQLVLQPHGVKSGAALPAPGARLEEQRPRHRIPHAVDAVAEPTRDMDKWR
ncbi:hypothetical protein DQ04_11771000 [Trypanosoma grayi]|uniref:hypothetical protein n=1 Tax=Trypanosoma grayi TaxID=71804 RepID=UPI0004F44E69|nr:hypothetical protein DQ04_11771000 [Trypanosoma grayi]KEG06889.1 hypothetical protein DQ04_11771000 [Trypanosoma grayi]